MKEPRFVTTTELLVRVVLTICEYKWLGMASLQHQLSFSFLVLQVKKEESREQWLAQGSMLLGAEKEQVQNNLSASKFEGMGDVGKS